MKECARNNVLNVVVIKINECSLQTPISVLLDTFIIEGSMKSKEISRLIDN